MRINVQSIIHNIIAQDCQDWSGQIDRREIIDEPPIVPQNNGMAIAVCGSSSPSMMSSFYPPTAIVFGYPGLLWSIKVLGCFDNNFELVRVQWRPCRAIALGTLTASAGRIANAHAFHLVMVSVNHEIPDYCYQVTITVTQLVTNLEAMTRNASRADTTTPPTRRCR